MPIPFMGAGEDLQRKLTDGRTNRTVVNAWRIGNGHGHHVARIFYVPLRVGLF